MARSEPHIDTPGRCRRGERLRSSLGVLALCSLGCDVTEIDVERRGSGTIPEAGSTPFEETEIVLGEFDADRDVKEGDLSSAIVDRLDVRVVEPAGADLAFAQRLEVFVEAPGLPPQRIGHAEDFRPGRDRLELETDRADITPYVAAESLTIFAVVEGLPPQEQVEIEGIANLRLGVTLQGACNHM